MLDVKSLKVAELKAELSSRGLDTKGLKKDLAERLQTFLDQQQPAQDADDVTIGETTSSPTLPDEPAEDVPAPPRPATPPPADRPPAPTPAAATATTAPAPPSPATPATPRSVRSATPPPPDRPLDPERPTPARLPTPPRESRPTTPPREPESSRPATPPPNEERPAPPPARPATPPTEPAQAPQSVRPAMPPRDVKMSEPQPEPEPEPKAPRPSEPQLALPPSLAHLSHPPTAVLYVSNLRRPFLLPDLHDLLSCTTLDGTPRHPFATADCPGLWLSGVKDHAYAGYASASAALKAAERINGLTWPEGMGAPLGVQFVDPAAVADLIAREERAWANGRTRLALTVERDGDGWAFDLVKAGAGGPMRGRPGFGLASRFTGVAPPRGPAADRDRDRGRPAPYARPGENGRPSGRGAVRYTVARPTLAWREGPRAR